jgi:hypothetical protein
MTDMEKWERTFQAMNNPYQWLSGADKLKRGADVIFEAYLSAHESSPEEQAESEDTRLDGVATLLYGLAMENVLKAVLLNEGVAQVDNDGTVTWNVEGAKEHDLLSICRSAKLLALTREQEKLMERMSAFVHWAGKYPTPLAFSAKKDFKGLLLSNQPGAAAIMVPVEV